MKITSEEIKKVLCEGKPNEVLDDHLSNFKSWLRGIDDNAIANIYPVFNCNYSLRKLFCYLCKTKSIKFEQIKEHKKSHPHVILFPLSEMLNSLQNKTIILPKDLLPIKNLNIPAFIILIGLLETSGEQRKGILLDSFTQERQINLSYEDTIIFGCLNIMHPLYKFPSHIIKKLGLPENIYEFYNDDNIDYLTNIINQL